MKKIENLKQNLMILIRANSEDRRSERLAG